MKPKYAATARPAAASARRVRFRFLVFFGLACVLAISFAGAASAQEWRYRVRPGDTVWDLAGKYVRHDIAWQRLQAHNRIADPYHLAPGSVMRFPVAWLKQQPAKAKVVALHGKATVSRARDAQPALVSEGMLLGIGSVLRTAPDASLTLEFADGSRLLLQGGSELALDKLSAYGATGMTDTRMRLPRGRTSSDVRPMRGPASRFIIRTPDTMSSVRGTRFRIGSDGIRSQAEVIEGRVAVAGGGRQVMLAPGHGTTSGTDGKPRPPLALLPAPTSLTLASDRRPMLVHWTPVPGARRYRVQVGTTTAFLALLHDRIVTDNHDTLDALPNGAYGLRVRAIDENGIEGRDALVEARVLLPPPFALAPANDSSTDAERPRFRWASMGDAVRYRLQLAGPDGFDVPLLDATGVEGESLRSPQPLAPGEYQWRIAAVDGDGRESIFNDPVRFRVLDPAPGPQVERVRNEERVPHVHWPAAQAGQRFRFQLSRQPSFSTVELDREIDDNQIALPGLRSGTWYARVQIVDSDDYAHPFGPAQRFRVGCLPCRIAAGGGIALLLLAL